MLNCPITSLPSIHDQVTASWVASFCLACDECSFGEAFCSEGCRLADRQPASTPPSFSSLKQYNDKLASPQPFGQLIDRGSPQLLAFPHELMLLTEVQRMREQSPHSMGWNFDQESFILITSALSMKLPHSSSYPTMGTKPRLGSRRRGQTTLTGTQLLAAYKRARLRQRPTGGEKSLLAVAREMHGNPRLRFREPGQRNGILAALGPQSGSCHQVVVVLGTGSGKSLIFLTGAALREAATTILILPTVALRNDMLGKLRRFGIKHHTWTPGSSRSASLVIATAEAACTSAFLDYARMLISQQMLDRVVVDECHLTITASEYRKSMVQLGWYVGQLKTQTLWLTATLPPTMQEAFSLQNKLVRPTVVRESTNRPNIQYIVEVDRVSRKPVAERAAAVIQASCRREDLFRSSRDKMIVFCQTKDLVMELAHMLGSPYYIGGHEMTEDEKNDAIGRWICTPSMRTIVATAALGPGFDYPHIRLVFHVGAPNFMTDFSQESGRAGRDRKMAESVVLLPAAWKPLPADDLSVDQEAMQLYLMQAYCSRGILSQFLDEQQDWRWCMAEDRCCRVCKEPHERRRPEGLVFKRAAFGDGLAREESEAFAGPQEVLRQDHVNDELVARYKRDLEIMRGTCLYCRLVGRDFAHEAGACGWRWDWIRAKKKALETCQKGGRAWMPRLVVCWTCYQPQHICRVADPEVEEEEDCEYKDMVIPLCYGKYKQPGSRDWLERNFQRKFETVEKYMTWLGSEAWFGGAKCVQATCVAALALSELA